MWPAKEIRLLPPLQKCSTYPEGFIRSAWTDQLVLRSSGTYALPWQRYLFVQTLEVCPWINTPTGRCVEKVCQSWHLWYILHFHYFQTHTHTPMFILRHTIIRNGHVQFCNPLLCQKVCCLNDCCRWTERGGKFQVFHIQVKIFLSWLYNTIKLIMPKK